LYESLITKALQHHLQGHELQAQTAGLVAADASDRLALHVSRILKRAIAGVTDSERVARGTAAARDIIALIDTLLEAEATPDQPVEPATVLHALLAKRPDGRAESIARPMIPLLDTTLLTNAPGEPRVGNQVLSEIQSADRVDIVMAFIRRSGILPMLEVLRLHCQAGRPLRVLTTVYTGSTEASALDQLRELGADVRAAQARNPDLVDKVSTVFESYWNSGDFVPYDRKQFVEQRRETPPPPLF